MRPARVTVLHGYGGGDFFSGACFPQEMLAFFSALKCASSILRGVKRYEAVVFPQHTQHQVSRCFLNSEANRKSNRSDVLLKVEKTEEESGRCLFLE